MKNSPCNQQPWYDVASLNWRRIQYMYILNKSLRVFLIGSRKKGSCQYLLLVCQPLLSIGSYILLFGTKDASSKRVQHSVWSNQASCQIFLHTNIKINTTDCIFPFCFILEKKKTWFINSISFFLSVFNFKPLKRNEEIISRKLHKNINGVCLY